MRIIWVKNIIVKILTKINHIFQHGLTILSKKPNDIFSVSANLF